MLPWAECPLNCHTSICTTTYHFVVSMIVADTYMNMYMYTVMCSLSTKHGKAFPHVFFSSAYIQAIMSMQQEVQHVVMGAIQDVSQSVYTYLII